MFNESLVFDEWHFVGLFVCILLMNDEHSCLWLIGSYLQFKLIIFLILKIFWNILCSRLLFRTKRNPNRRRRSFCVWMEIRCEFGVKIISPTTKQTSRINFVWTLPFQFHYISRQMDKMRRRTSFSCVSALQAKYTAWHLCTLFMP